MDRQRFYKPIGRGGALGALVVISGVLVAQTAGNIADECSDNGFQCRTCNKLNRCELPDAKITRDHGEEG